MPRADSKHPQYYSPHFSSPPQYLPDSASPSPTPAAQPAPSAAAPVQKKKHVCSVCDRPFSTSGHLARHSRVHTGERNHKCPFPGCETRCSRQDNLQQHYRIHLSPGSRRSSTRSAISRAMNGSATAKRNSAPSSAVDPPLSPPPLSAPPALEQAHVYNHSPPPDSPPPLAQATLPATAHIPSTSSSRSSSSPDTPYSSSLASFSSQPQSQGNQSYSYRSSTSSYQDQSQGAGYTYVHTAPLSHPSSGSNSNSFPSYNTHSGFNNHSLPHINTSSPVLHSQHSHDSPNPTPISSRHSISHISHPQSYPQNQSSSTEPASPASSHSHTSGPATPSYGYHDEARPYHHNGMVNDQSNHPNGHLGPQNNYPSSVGVTNHQRFDSPPPTLAPIQKHHYNQRDERSSDSHSSNSYIHNNHSLPDYSYHQSIPLAHNAWKSESGIRKGVGALVQ